MRVKLITGRLLGLIMAASMSLVAFTSMAQKGNSKPIRVLIIGGNSSHDFARWFGEEDAKTLEANGLATITYTENMDSIPIVLPQTDVLFLSNNKPIENASTRKMIFDFVDAGHGLLLGHAATWYNFYDWPEYNEHLVGGGAMGHNEYQPFKVVITKDHPVTKNVPKTFTAASDELYFFYPDNLGENITVLAKSYLPKQPNKFFPSVFIVKHPKARIVGITLGHDGAAHQSQEYKTILVNSLKWVANK